MTVTVYTPSAPCIKNDAAGYSFTISLTQQADTKLFQDNPTMNLVDGDFKITLDGIYLDVITNIPVAVAGNTREVQVTLTQAEINANEVSIMCHDGVGAQWCDLKIVITTSQAKSVGTSDLTLANILAGVFEGTFTIQDFFRLASSVLFGKSTDGGTVNPKFRDLADTKNRISATVDTSGNRSSVTRDVT